MSLLEPKLLNQTPAKLVLDVKNKQTIYFTYMVDEEYVEAKTKCYQEDKKNYRKFSHCL